MGHSLDSLAVLKLEVEKVLSQLVPKLKSEKGYIKLVEVARYVFRAMN